MKKTIFILSAVMVLSSCSSPEKAAEEITTHKQQTQADIITEEVSETQNSDSDDAQIYTEYFTAAPEDHISYDTSADTGAGTRDTTEHMVTAGELEEEFGFRFYIPEGAEEVTYAVDTADRSSPRGFVGFYLDGILWNAHIIRSDSYKRIDEPYLEKCDWEEIVFSPDKDQVMQVHGTSPDVKYFLIHYNSDIVNDAYMLYAHWFLEDEGFMISLTNYSEQPVHTMPVELFG